MSYLTFGDIIKEARIARGLKLKDVAKKTEIDLSTLAKIEKNQRDPSNAFLTKVSKFLCLDEQELRKNYLSDKLVEKISNEDNPVAVLKLAEKKVAYKINPKIDGTN